MWVVDNINIDLNLMFVFDSIPLRRDVLERYVHRFISNDKQK